MLSQSYRTLLKTTHFFTFDSLNLGTIPRPYLTSLEEQQIQAATQ
jgi:hypothetical protein